MSSSVLSGTNLLFNVDGGTAIQVTASSAKLTLTPDTKIEGLAQPTAESGVATKAYVDSYLEGLDIKESCQVATTANIANFPSVTSVDGETLVNNDRVLVKDQTTGSQNGIYKFTLTSTTLARADDMAIGTDAAGSFTFIEKGTVNGDKGFTCTDSKGSAEVDTNSLTFTQFSGAGQITAGAGLTKSGDTISISDGGVTNAMMHDEAINTDQIVANAVTTAKIADGAVGSSQLASESAQTATITDADQFILNDDGVMKQVSVTALKTYTAASSGVFKEATQDHDDLNIELTGNYDSSLILSSTGTGTDAIQIMASVGGMDIIAANALDISTSANNANITIDPNGSGTLALGHPDNTAVTLDALALTLTSGGAISLDAHGASSNLTLLSTADAHDLTIALTGATESSLILSSAGTGSDAMQLTASAGGMKFETATNIMINSTATTEQSVVEISNVPLSGTPDTDTVLLQLSGNSTTIGSGMKVTDVDVSIKTSSANLGEEESVLIVDTSASTQHHPAAAAVYIKTADTDSYGGVPAGLLVDKGGIAVRETNQDKMMKFYHDGTNGIVETADSGSAGGGGNIRFKNDILIPNTGYIGSTSYTDAISISAVGVVSITATTGNTDSTDGALTVAGGVGIAENLTVNSNITAGGNITCSSDIRLKKDIVEIDNCVDKVKKLRGVNFKWIKDDRDDFGVIAQEVEEVAPHAVIENKEGMKSVDYGRLTTLLIQAVKEQQTQIDELKDLVAKLTNKE